MIVDNDNTKILNYGREATHEYLMNMYSIVLLLKSMKNSTEKCLSCRKSIMKNFASRSYVL